MNTKLATAIILINLVSLTALSWSNADMHTPIASRFSGSKPLWTSETILKLNTNERDVRISTFRNNVGPAIKFRQITSELKSETTAVIHVTIDNGEREREFDVVGSVLGDSLILKTTISAYYYNYSKTFSASIPLK